MMNVYSSFNEISIDPEIAPIVSDNDLIPDLFPFLRMVETLIEVPIEPKRIVTNAPIKLQVTKSFVKRLKVYQIGVTPELISKAGHLDHRHHNRCNVALLAWHRHKAVLPLLATPMLES